MASAPKDSDARAAALRLLHLVLDKGKPLDQLLAQRETLAGLEARDRAFARLLVVTVLRRLGQIDDLLAGLTKLAPKMREQRNILRLGAAQLLFLKTPPHAAISTALKLAETPRSRAHKKLINAVLARLDREGAGLLAGQDAARLNTPDWLWESWSAAYGAERARAIAEAHLHEPPLDLTVKSDAAGWAEKLSAEPLPTGSLRLTHAGDVRALPGYEEGAWWVQDAAAALPVKLLGDLAGRRVYDLCAAPGGKTAQLAAAGAEVSAVDLSVPRLALVAENLRRLGLNAELVQADVAAWRPERQAEAVLLDAPCSATGTLRRHPDIAWLKGAEVLESLLPLQAALLERAAGLTEPGGRLVYAVCSLQPEEGPGQVESFLRVHPDWTREAVWAQELGGEDGFVTPEGDLRTLPCHWPAKGGLDGFYACRLRLKR